MASKAEQHELKMRCVWRVWYAIYEHRAGLSEADRLILLSRFMKGFFKRITRATSRCYLWQDPKHLYNMVIYWINIGPQKFAWKASIDKYKEDGSKLVGQLADYLGLKADINIGILDDYFGDFMDEDDHPLYVRYHQIPGATSAIHNRPTLHELRGDIR